MKTLLILTLSAFAINLSAAALKPTFKYDTNKFTAVQDAGTWRLVEKNAAVPEPVEPVSFVSRLSFAPVGVIKTEDLDGRSQWGAGLQVGYDINPFVAIQFRALSFEGDGKSSTAAPSTDERAHSSAYSGEDDWGGRLVDEIGILVPARISRFSNESFSLLVIPSGNYDLNTDDYGVGVGLGAELKFNEHVSLSGSYSVRAWFHKPTHVDGLAALQVNIGF